MMQQVCPYPYAGPGDLVTVDCEPTSYANLTYDLTFSKTVQNLAPYTKYEFFVVAYNGHPTQNLGHNISAVITDKTGRYDSSREKAAFELMISPAQVIIYIYQKWLLF